MSAIQKSTKSISVPSYLFSGEKAENTELPLRVFSTELSEALLAQYVKVFLHNQRQGNASAKTRGEIVGSTKKIYKQKGTGRARHGSKKAPIFKGGGVVGGPLPKIYLKKMTKKQKKSALFGALTYQYKQKNIIVLKGSETLTKPSTKSAANFFSLVSKRTDQVLLIFPDMKKSALMYSVQNLPFVTSTDVNSLNAYIVLKNTKIFFLDSAVSKLNDLSNDHENK